MHFIDEQHAGNEFSHALINVFVHHLSTEKRISNGQTLKKYSVGISVSIFWTPLLCFLGPTFQASGGVRRKSFLYIFLETAGLSVKGSLAMFLVSNNDVNIMDLLCTSLSANNVSIEKPGR